MNQTELMDELQELIAQHRWNELEAERHRFPPAELAESIRDASPTQRVLRYPDESVGRLMKHRPTPAPRATRPRR